MKLEIFDLDLIEFSKARDFQKEVFARVRRGDFSFGLIICRHYPVFTLGRSAKKESLLQDLAQTGLPAYQVERGGDVTYHGPGQVTVYPVFDLHYLKKDINQFLRNLEQVVMDLLGDFGIRGVRREGLTGVWVEEEGAAQKIASIGISIKNWITFHGLSLNVKQDDLKNFSLIKPCGMDIEMTSLESVLGRVIEISDIKQSLARIFRGTFAADREGVPSWRHP